jgi:hypothetical protein
MIEQSEYSKIIYSEKIIRLFLKKFNQTENQDECWPWLAAKNKDGYGIFVVVSHGRNFLAHRFAYELFIGKIPEGKHLIQICGNHSCINPNHLYLKVDFLDKILKSNIENLSNRSEKEILMNDSSLPIAAKKFIHKRKVDGGQNFYEYNADGRKIIRPKLTEKERTDIIKRHKSGESYKSIAESLRRDYTTIRKICINYKN